MSENAKNDVFKARRRRKKLGFGAFLDHFGGCLTVIPPLVRPDLQQGGGITVRHPPKMGKNPAGGRKFGENTTRNVKKTLFSVYSRGQNRENFLACGGLLVQKTLFSVYSRGRIRKNFLACGGLFVFRVKI